MSSGVQRITRRPRDIVEIIASHEGELRRLRRTLANVGASAVSDHGDLTGLGDDDHTDYHTDARALTWHDADDHSGLLPITESDISDIGTHTHTYLPLAGGTLTGPLFYGNSFADVGGSIRAYDVVGREILLIEGGDGDLSDARLQLYGNDDTANPGDLHVYADETLFRDVSGTTQLSVDVDAVTVQQDLMVAGTSIYSNGDLYIRRSGLTDTDYYLLDAGFHRWYLNGNEVMRVNDAGDLGIRGTKLMFEGITNDTYLEGNEGSYFRFVYSNDEILRLTNTSNNTFLDFYDSGYGMLRNQEAGHLYIENNVSNQHLYLRVSNAGVKRTRITIGGNSDISMTNKDGVVKFSVGNSGIVFNDEIFGTSGMTSTGSSSYNEIVHNASTYQFYRFTSRRDVKKNIKDMPEDVSKGIYKLQPRIFDMRVNHRTGNDWADLGQYGFIADEVHEIWGDQGATPGEDGEPAGWSHKLITVMMVKEMQELRKDVDDLQAISSIER